MGCKTHRILFLLLSTSISVDANEKFRVCGAYCGPGWCNNMWIPEDKCNTTILPEYHHLTGYSCADSCCQNHDRCCGKNPRFQSLCNTNLVNCLSRCNPLSLTCTLHDIPFPAGIIEGAMEIVDHWCCGKPCPSIHYNILLQ